MSSTKIEFYKLRDFSEKMNTTVEFIRQNFKKFSLSVLLIGGPMAILISLVFRDMFSLFDFSNMGQNDEQALDFMTRLGGDYLLMMFLSWMTTLFIISITYQFMVKYNNDDLENFTIGELFGKAVQKLPGLVLLSFLIFIVVFVGIFLFILPGIYLAVTLSLAYPVYLFENVGIGEAFSRPFRLIRGKWWSTFGVIFIGAMMAYAVSLVFSIPFLFIYISELFTLVQEAPDDPSAFANMFTSGYMTFAMTISNIGSYVSYSVPLVALGYQYSNLVERTESRGLLSQIDDFDKAD